MRTLMGACSSERKIEQWPRSNHAGGPRSGGQARSWSRKRIASAKPAGRQKWVTYCTNTLAYGRLYLVIRQVVRRDGGQLGVGPCQFVVDGGALKSTRKVSAIRRKKEGGDGGSPRSRAASPVSRYPRVVFLVSARLAGIARRRQKAKGRTRRAAEGVGCSR